MPGPFHNQYALLVAEEVLAGSVAKYPQAQPQQEHFNNYQNQYNKEVESIKPEINEDKREKDYKATITRSNKLSEERRTKVR